MTTALQVHQLLNAMFDAPAVMLAVLHSELQHHHLGKSHLQELSLHSGGALHYVASLCSQPLMYQGMLLHDRGASALMRLLVAGFALADIVKGEWHAGCVQWHKAHCTLLSVVQQ
eukprot:jgi/Chrzof1/14607/Cz09g09080.t1